MKVQFTKFAKKALDKVYEWHKERGAGKAGRKIRAAILRKAMMLKEHPYLGQEEELLKDLELGHRYIVEGNYKIVYFIADKLSSSAELFDT